MPAIDPTKPSRKRRSAVAAMSLSLVIGLVSAPVRADCQAYVAPDICGAAWSLPDRFWTGSYDIELGPMIMIVDGALAPGPSEPPPPGAMEIGMQGGNLLLSHPNIGEGVMQATAPDMAAWDWEDALFQDAAIPSLSDVELAWDCSNTELPRWIAHVGNPNGPDLQLELVAVTELTIFGRVSIPEDGRMDVRRRMVLARESFPIEGLEPRVFTSDQCDKLCPSDAVVCPDREQVR